MFTILNLENYPGHHQWISCVLLSLQSLLNNEPLSHEPGFEKYNGPISEDYKSIVYYDNILSLL